MKNNSIGLILLLLIFSSAIMFADGAGGVLFGTQTATIPLLEEFSIRNNSMNLFYGGGFGYGILESNQMIGGFGISFGDTENDDGTGGIGGLILGHRIIGRPVFLALLLNIGVGGLAIKDLVGGYSGYFVLFGELNFEAGLPIFPWFMISGYLGYQLMGSVITGGFFDSFVSYTPVVGLKFSFGKFY